MKKLFTFLCCFWFAISFAQTNSNHVYVNGYYRSNGTYVAPHYRTVPNSTVNDNFSTVGNTNPYTGKAGYLPRESNPTYSTLPAYTPPKSINTYYPAKEISDLTVSKYKPPVTVPDKPKRTNAGGKYFKVSDGKKNYVCQTL